MVVICQVRGTSVFWLDGTVEPTVPIDKPPFEPDYRVTTLSIPARLKHTGKEMRIKPLVIRMVQHGASQATAVYCAAVSVMRINALAAAAMHVTALAIIARWNALTS
jgi:hypothetical protein